MFGTGGRGFSIITVVIPVITYALVFNLLHPTTKKGIEEGIENAILIWPGLFWHMLWDGIKKVATWFEIFGASYGMLLRRSLPGFSIFGGLCGMVVNKRRLKFGAEMEA